jgi:hypothetical protein
LELVKKKPLIHLNKRKMIHEHILKWNGKDDEFTDKITVNFEALVDEANNFHEYEMHDKDVEDNLPKLNSLEDYDFYHKIKRKIDKSRDLVDNLTQNIKDLKSYNDLLNKKLLTQIPLLDTGDRNFRSFHCSYIYVQPEHRLSQYAFLGMQNYINTDTGEFYTERLLDKFLNVLGISYLNISNRSSYFNLNVATSAGVKNISPAVMAMNNISGYLKRIRFNHHYNLENYRHEKEKLSFEIKSTFDDEALTILFEVIDIQGQWILEDIVLNSEVLAFKGRKVLFQFVESHSRQMLAHDHYFYF